CRQSPALHWPWAACAAPRKSAAPTVADGGRHWWRCHRAREAPCRAATPCPFAATLPRRPSRASPQPSPDCRSGGSSSCRSGSPACRAAPAGTRARAPARSTPPLTRGRPDVEPLHLAGALPERPQRDTAGELLAVAHDEDRVVAVGERGELSLGVYEPAVRSE